jgi:hypothetical protein
MMTTSLEQSPGRQAAIAAFRPFAGSAAFGTDRIYVVYTDIEPTLAAARAAAPFAELFGATPTVVHFQTVPYPQPVDFPIGISPIETAGFLRSLRSEALDVRIQVYLCRDERRRSPMRSHARRWCLSGVVGPGGASDQIACAPRSNARGTWWCQLTPLASRRPSMLDLFYLAIGTVGFVALWAITRACDRV